MEIRRGLMMGMAKGVYKKLYSGEIQCSTTSTSVTNISTITVDGAYTENKIIYIKVRDKVGRRDGYYFGNDCFAIKGSSGVIFVYRGDSGSLVVSSASFGIYVRAIDTNGTITMASRYNSSITLTIDGTYTVEIYALDWPNNDAPFDS